MKLVVSVSAHTASLMLTLAYSQTIKTLAPIIVIMLSKLFYRQHSEPLYVYVSVALMVSVHFLFIRVASDSLE